VGKERVKAANWVGRRKESRALGEMESVFHDVWLDTHIACHSVQCKLYTYIQRDGVVCVRAFGLLLTSMKQRLSKNTVIRRSLFNSSSGSCHDSDATWQEIGRTCGSACSFLRPGSRTASLLSEYVLPL